MDEARVRWLLAEERLERADEHTARCDALREATRVEDDDAGVVTSLDIVRLAQRYISEGMRGVTMSPRCTIPAIGCWRGA